jgi:hypothetical protein
MTDDNGHKEVGDMVRNLKEEAEERKPFGSFTPDPDDEEGAVYVGTRSPENLEPYIPPTNNIFSNEEFQKRAAEADQDAVEVNTLNPTEKCEMRRKNILMILEQCVADEEELQKRRIELTTELNEVDAHIEEVHRLQRIINV